MKQLRVLCLSLALMFSLSGCCCGLFGHGSGGGGFGGAGFAPSGGCPNCGNGGGAFFAPNAGFPAAGGCGPNGCGTTTFPSGSLYGGPSAATTTQAGPVAYAPLQPIATY